MHLLEMGELDLYKVGIGSRYLICECLLYTSFTCIEEYELLGSFLHFCDKAVTHNPNQALMTLCQPAAVL